ncbi:MAG: hypothetical protein M3328_00230 [Chloroflexota bacterium]|nr:hypothetical protein [Chloroflexota bacterium]
MYPTNRRHAALLLTLSVLALSGCTLPFMGRSGPATPEQAVTEFYQRAKFSPPIQSYTILGSRVSGNRAVVFTTETRDWEQNGSPTHRFVVQHVTRDPQGWQTEGGGDSDERPNVSPPSLVCGQVTMGNDGGGSYTAVTGRVKQPDVASLEVDFTSGETITDTTADGMFAVILSRSDPPTEVRLIDGEGHLIHTVVPPIMQAQPPAPTPVVSSQSGGMVVETMTMQADTANIECSP